MIIADKQPIIFNEKPTLYVLHKAFIGIMSYLINKHNNHIKEYKHHIYSNRG